MHCDAGFQKLPEIVQNGDASDPEMAARRRDNDESDDRRNHASSKTSDSEATANN